MLRTLAVSAVVVASGAPTTETCALHAASSVDNLGDAAVDIWAATQRCKEGGDQVHCEIDSTAAAQAVGKAIDSILRAAKECGSFQDEHDCGIHVTELVSSSAGLATHIGGVIEHCEHGHSYDGLKQETQLGKCIVNAKDSLKSLITLGAKVAKLHGGDDDAEAAGLFAELGHFVSATVAHCQQYKGKDNVKAFCASSALGMAAELDKLGVAGERAGESCSARAQRLFEEDKKKGKGKGKGDEAGKANNLMMMLALPVCGVLSFVAGNRFGRNRGAIRVSAESDIETELTLGDEI